MNTEQYLERILYTGEREPTIEVLTALQYCHLLNVPFENLDIHYNHPIILDTHGFCQKIILRKRGGFCYELNSLFNELLKAFGFETRIISARVHTKDNVYSPEYDHLAIVVKIGDKEYLSDIGFGEFAFAPLELIEDRIQEDKRGNFIIDRNPDGYYRVSKIEDSQPTPEYIFSTVERPLHEFAAMCHYHQTDNRSHFKQRKLISRPTLNGRITLTENYLKIVAGGEPQLEEISNETDFENRLLEYFGIDITILK